MNLVEELEGLRIENLRVQEHIKELLRWASEEQEPPFESIWWKLPEHPNPEEPYKERQLSDISRIVIHHVGVNGEVSPQTIANYHIRNKGWHKIGYHFYVEFDGTAWQVNELTTVSNHCSDKDHCNWTSVGICLEGSFMAGREPTNEQIEATKAVIGWLFEELGEFPVIGHKEVLKTACPGSTWYNWADKILP